MRWFKRKRKDKRLVWFEVNGIDVELGRKLLREFDEAKELGIEPTILFGHPVITVQDAGFKNLTFYLDGYKSKVPEYMSLEGIREELLSHDETRRSEIARVKAGQVDGIKSALMKGVL